MAGRQLHGFAGTISLVDVFPHERAEARRRRALAATFCGFALFAIAASLLFPRVATAEWRPSGLFSIFSGYPTEVVEPQSAIIDIPLPSPHRKPANHAAAYSTSAVCVRLCDGYFFPAPAAGAAGCASLCPDAQTALYRMSGGSDRIEDAVSSTSGARYSALPAALRYRTTVDNACACRAARDSAAELMRDPTLRKGDAVMTVRGMLVYRGARGDQHAPRDFATLAEATLPTAQRTALAAMERVSLGPAREATRLAAIAPAPVKPRENQIRLVERSVPAVN